MTVCPAARPLGSGIFSWLTLNFDNGKSSPFQPGIKSLGRSFGRSYNYFSGRGHIFKEPKASLIIPPKVIQNPERMGKIWKRRPAYKNTPWMEKVEYKKSRIWRLGEGEAGALSVNFVCNPAVSPLHRSFSLQRVVDLQIPLWKKIWNPVACISSSCKMWTEVMKFVWAKRRDYWLVNPPSRDTRMQLNSVSMPPSVLSFSGIMGAKCKVLLHWSTLKFWSYRRAESCGIINPRVRMVPKCSKLWVIWQHSVVGFDRV